jgi:hypothetical protein
VILGALSVGVVLLSGCSGNHNCKTFDNCGTVEGGSGDDGGGDPFNDDSGMITGGDGGMMNACQPNPGNFDVPGNNCDDDGDGKVDNGPADCDVGLQLTGDGYAFAKSIGLCNKASGPQDQNWGVITAVYTKGYNSMQPPDTNQHGILPKFGNTLKARDGQSLGVLSSGYAREYDQCNTMNGPFKGGCAMPMGGPGTAPPGFPKPAQGCPISMSINDVSTLHLQIKVPNNAKGFSFDFNFFSGEWPEWVCTNYNDAFIAFLKSTAFNNGQADNISFDQKKNPVSVNNGFFDRCAPKNATVGCAGSNPSTNACAGGATDLMGTGFYIMNSQSCGQNDSGGGATGWLTTSAPVKQGEVITLDFMIWDTGDAVYDSSVLIDKFIWQAGDTMTGTVRPPN